MDFDSAVAWQNMMDGGNPAGVWVSWANWGWNDKGESCSYLNPGSCDGHSWGSHSNSGSHVDDYLKRPGPPSGPPSPPSPSPSPSPGVCDTNPGQNNNGQNLETTARSASSPSACCDLCSQASGCVGYTHVTGKNECWLKSALGGLTSDSYVNSGSVKVPPPTPGPPPPAPTPSPPSPSPSGCPGGSLEACIGACPTSPAAAFGVCVSECTARCGGGESCTGGDDGSDLPTCMGHCPTDSHFGDCVNCCADKFPSATLV